MITRWSDDFRATLLCARRTSAVFIFKYYHFSFLGSAFSFSLFLSLFLSLFRNQLDSEIDSLRVLHTYTLIDSSTHALSFSFLFFFSLFLCPLIPAFDPLNFDRCLTSTPRTPPFAFPGETRSAGSVGRL